MNKRGDKRPKDPRGGHIRLYTNLYDSPAWRALGPSEQCLWLAMRRRLLGSNNGNISATMRELRHFGFNSPTTVAKALRALEATGFIRRTRHGGIARGTKVCSLYRFTDEPCFEHPKLGVPACQATNDWKEFKAIAIAKAAIEQAHAAKGRRGPRTWDTAKGSGLKKKGVQKVFRSDTGSVSDPPIPRPNPCNSHGEPDTASVRVALQVSQEKDERNQKSTADHR